jgi:hypothetical protein
MTLLRQIQQDLANPSSDVTNVLRKCKILAARLSSHELSRWAGWELNGYPDTQPTPGYRRLVTSWFGDFVNVEWTIRNNPIPESLFPERFRDKLRQIEFREGIAKAVAMVSAGARIEEPEIASLITAGGLTNMHCIRAWRSIPGSEFEQLISAIKNRVLDFVLRIEAENPDAGEAAVNSEPVPREKLQPLVHNVFYGPIGSFAQNSDRFSQTAKIGI